MSKRQRQADQNHHQCRCSCGKVPEPACRRQSKHLYIVLDDWEAGYSIHKLDADSFFFSDEDDFEHSGARAELTHLPEPPAARLAHSGQLQDMFIASLGSKILLANGVEYNEQACTLAYDTDTAAMTTGPNLPGNLYGLTATAEEKLYALSGQSNETGQTTRVSFEVLSWVRGGGLSSNNAHRWFWDIDTPPPAPFNGSEEAVVAYAVHPDGHTIFFSTKIKGRRSGHTYSFDTVRSKWRWHGGWVLPFLGQGYFDRELDARVGLRREEEDRRGYYVCTCQVASRSGRAEPEWTTAKGELFQEVPRERHLGATLTHMGDSKFCLVERVIHEDVDVHASGHVSALHVTFFGLKYNRKGELQVTNRRTTKSYAVPRHLKLFELARLL